MQLEAQDIEKMVVADRPNEIELDEVIYTEKMSVKERNVSYPTQEAKGDCSTGCWPSRSTLRTS